MKRTVIIVVLFIVVVGMSFGIMRFLVAQKKMPKVVETPEVTRYVKTAEVAYSSVSAEVTGEGRVYSLANVDIMSEGAGKILQGSVPLKNGQVFKKGDLLFSIYKDEVELALKARKSNFMQLLANLLPDIKIDHASAYNEFKAFFDAIDVSKDLPQLPNIQNDQLKLLLAARNILSEYYSIRKDELSVKRYAVYAPFDGTYNAVNYEVGAYANVGARVATAISTNQVEVELAVSEVDCRFIELGDEVKLEGETEGVWKGKVVRISGYVDASTQSRLVYAKITSTEKKPVPGQYVTATFYGHTLENVMEIPRNAVFNANEIFTLVDGRLKMASLNVLKSNKETMLFNGLPEGTTIVVQPLIGVTDGSKVSRLADAPAIEAAKKKEMGNGPGRMQN